MQEIKKINLSLEWKYEKLGKLCSFDKEGVNPKEDIKYYHYSFPAFDNNKEPEVEVGKDIKSSKFLFNKGDILFNKLNVKFKRVWDIDFDIDENSICSTEFIPIQAKNIDRNFLYYCLISPNFTNEMKYLSTGTSNSHQRINPKDIKDYDLFLPTDEEIQKKIGYILKLLDKKISMNVEINKNLEQLSQILFKKWLIDFDLKNEFSISEPFKESNLGKIPESWEIKTIGDLSDVKGRIGWRGYTTNDLVDDGPWVVGGKEITSGFIDFNSAKHLTREKYEESPEIMLKDKDLIIAKTGTIGPIAMFYEIYGDATLNPNVGLIRSKMIAPALLLTFFKTPRAQYYLNEFTTSSVQPAINQTTIKQLEVAIPSDKQLLEKIGNKFEEINLLQFNLNEEIKKLQKLRDTLLPKLMSGEIDVSEVNCDLELKYNYMKYLFNQIHTPMSKSVV